MIHIFIHTQLSLITIIKIFHLINKQEIVIYLLYSYIYLSIFFMNIFYRHFIIALIKK